MLPEIIGALARIKAACAHVSVQLQLLLQDKALAIAAAAQEVMSALHALESLCVADRVGHTKPHEHERGVGQPRV